MRNILTFILVKKAVTFASALLAVGFVYYYGQISDELSRAKLELESKKQVIASLATTAAPLPERPVTDIAKVMKKAEPVKVTCYSNTVDQCDDDPETCAWGNKFTEYFRGFKTIAISRDLLAKGWKFGDLIYVAGVGKCVVWDLMHPRMKKSIDLAVYDTRKFGDNFKSVAVPMGDGAS